MSEGAPSIADLKNKFESGKVKNKDTAANPSKKIENLTKKFESTSTTKSTSGAAKPAKTASKWKDPAAKSAPAATEEHHDLGNYSAEELKAMIAKSEKHTEALRSKLHRIQGGTLASHAPDKWEITILGQKMVCDKDVRVNVGPIIGKVTDTTAIVLLEVTLSQEVIAHFVPRNNPKGTVKVMQMMNRNSPKAFVARNLAPNTIYDVCFEGINAKDATHRIGRVKTFPENITQLKVAAVSCDRPERQKEGETNMWEMLEQQIQAGEVDVVLHLGDQVYGQKEFVDAQAILRFSDAPKNPRTADEKSQVSRLHKAIKERMRDIYRFTWNMPFTRTVLSHCSNLMIWSDNDLYNDFTVAQEDGKPLEPLMIQLGQQVYREYQRQLWDPDFEKSNGVTSDEFHYHQWGGVGIMMLDMRGNRITCGGQQCIENPIMNDAQWAIFEAALKNNTLKSLLVCSEIPYVEDTPEVAMKNSETIKGLEFLKDHWTCNKDELVRLLESVFDWRAAGAGKRDAILLGGDIHVGVESVVKDAKTNSTMQQLTCTPITNHVCDFFPKLEGAVDDRFTYTHTPLKHRRNYGYVVASVAGGAGKITGKLVGGEPTAEGH